MAITVLSDARLEGCPSHHQRRREPPKGDIMTKNRSGLLAAAGLLLTVLPTAAFAELRETPERRAACMGDAIMLCRSAIPDKERIASCLASKMSQLSPGCRAQFGHGKTAAR
jgi:hypothetical protein